MRLEKIKLAGFKSFVDPTTVPLPGNLTGIVGPNGCGKSNVIDAVRWVMGESSARMLRGESMADVIFNGSSHRKPVGTAGIELVFDNSDGAAGGEYAKYSQISVKRQVSRDSQSDYFLNGARCRRRDIQDLFLGTGLGPRSYAIIEQGTISRLIEARPEELRRFLEEAAGISKYKERRRETENRIQHTRENLSRLEDVREEVAKQLAHLERQAAAAERYRHLKEEEGRLETELQALRWQALDADLGAREAVLDAGETALQESIARQRRLEAEIEDQRAAFAQASADFNAIQGRYYAVGAAIARLEQGLQFARETRARQQADWARTEAELGAVREHLDRDQARIADLEAALERDTPALAEAEEGQEEALDQVEAAEEALTAWEAGWDRFNREAAAPAQQAQVERARLNHLEQRLARDQVRGQRLEEEEARLDTAALEARVREGETRRADLDARMAELDDEDARLMAARAAEEEAWRALGGQLDQARAARHAARGREASLLALQEAARRDGDAALACWLKGRGLATAPRLLDELQVAAGWETAVEAVLGDFLKAVCTDDLDAHAPEAESAGALVLLDAGPAAETAAAGGILLEQVSSPWPLQGLLGGVRPVASLEQALAERATLGPGERLVTRQGLLMGRHWLRAPGRDHPLGGVLARGEELKALQEELHHQEQQLQALEANQQDRREQRQAREQAHEILRQHRAGVAKTLSDLHAELTGYRARLEHQGERRRALAAERQELQAAQAEALEEMGETRERLHALLDTIDGLAEQREALVAERDRLRATVLDAREAERAWRDQVQSLRVEVESARAAREATADTLERARAQHAQYLERLEELRLSLEEAQEPIQEQEVQREEQLALRLEEEKALGEARRRLEELDAGVRTRDRERHGIEAEIRERQGTLDTWRLERQERLVLRRTLEDQLRAAALEPSAVLAAMDANAEIGIWEQHLAQTTQRIARLGNVNLAAIDEFEELSERKRYLDAQHADIARALDTLEQVIRRIDRETRSRFKETYDQVNQGLQQLFPRLFGGGHAYLELTGEDLLETGVTVMARPPGKRNSSIHLLSGGEKALTAVALVFAIFQLNPAPFCLLDEVDAPLDDANVGRFCELVRAMSAQVQFIFISHNKVTMEIADHLMGVTMHEPGVSRLVAVDVEEAARLAALS